MDSHRALCQALCVLLCLASYTTGSDIVFTTTPSTIQHLITEYLTLRCSLKDAPTTGTSGIVGKRHALSDVTSLGNAFSDVTSLDNGFSDVTSLDNAFSDVTSLDNAFSDVTLRGAAPSDIQFVNSIMITKNGADVATVSEHVPATGFDNTSGVHITGQVTGNGAEKGMLQVDWKYPGPDQIGSYQCVISGIDQSGHVQSFSKTVEVAENEVSLKDLVGYIHQLKITNDLQTATIVNNTKIITDQAASITELNKKNADQAASITELKHRQDARVLFTAGVDHDITVHYPGVIVFNHVITSVGGGYSTSTGVFTCPMAGYYVFHVHITSQIDKVVDVCIRHNGSCVSALVADDGLDYQTGSTSVSLLLRNGDTVKVGTIGTAYLHSNSGHYATFTGQLVALL